jgi:hypothetical protein
VQNTSLYRKAWQTSENPLLFNRSLGDSEFFHSGTMPVNTQTPCTEKSPLPTTASSNCTTGPGSRVSSSIGTTIRFVPAGRQSGAERP